MRKIVAFSKEKVSLLNFFGRIKNFYSPFTILQSKTYSKYVKRNDEYKGEMNMNITKKMDLHEAYAITSVVENTIDRLNNLNNRLYMFQEFLSGEVNGKGLADHLTDILDGFEDLERERVCEVTLSVNGKVKSVKVNIVEQACFDAMLFVMRDFGAELARVVLLGEEADHEEFCDEIIQFLISFKTFLDDVYDQLVSIGEKAIEVIESHE